MKVVIIGNGIAGITAARFIRKLSDHEIVVISKESDYFISRPALMYVYMGHIPVEALKPYEDNFWQKNRITLIRDEVTEIHPDQKEIVLDDAGHLSYDKLIIATGSVPALYNWPGQDLSGVGTFYSLQDLEYVEAYSSKVKSTVIVGGGLIGIEMAEMLHSRGKKVHMLVRENSFGNIILPDEESKLVSEHIRNSGINLLLSTELKEIKGENGMVTSVITSNNEEISCDFVGIATGVKPNISFLKSTNLNIDRGVVADEFLQTNIPDIYAIGDCAQISKPRPNRKSIEAIWYTGRMMGETVAYTICGQKKEYDPGNWFNSAKFIDLEYQVYGHAPAQILPPVDSILWLDSKRNRSLRMYFDATTNTFTGSVSLGVRMRQEIADKWIHEKKNIESCRTDLKELLFQTEFDDSNFLKKSQYVQQ